MVVVRRVRRRRWHWPVGYRRGEPLVLGLGLVHIKLLHENGRRRTADRAKGVELATQFDTQLTALADKNRERAPTADLAAVARGASSLLAGFLEVAATRYTVPAMPELVNAPTVFAPADSLKR